MTEPTRAFAELMQECERKLDERRAEESERRELTASEWLALYGLAAEVSGWRP